MFDHDYFDHVLIRVTVIIIILLAVFVFSSLGYNRKLILDNKILIQQLGQKLEHMHIGIIRNGNGGSKK